MEFTRKNYGYKQCNLDSKLTTKTSQTAWQVNKSDGTDKAYKWAEINISW